MIFNDQSKSQMISKFILHLYKKEEDMFLLCH